MNALDLEREIEHVRKKSVSLRPGLNEPGHK